MPAPRTRRRRPRVRRGRLHARAGSHRRADRRSVRPRRRASGRRAAAVVAHGVGQFRRRSSRRTRRAAGHRDDRSADPVERHVPTASAARHVGERRARTRRGGRGRVVGATGAAADSAGGDRARTRRDRRRSRRRAPRLAAAWGVPCVEVERSQHTSIWCTISPQSISDSGCRPRSRRMAARPVHSRRDPGRTGRTPWRARAGWRPTCCTSSIAEPPPSHPRDGPDRRRFYTVAIAGTLLMKEMSLILGAAELPDALDVRSVPSYPRCSIRSARRRGGCHVESTGPVRRPLRPPIGTGSGPEPEPRPDSPRPIPVQGVTCPRRHDHDHDPNSERPADQGGRDRRRCGRDVGGSPGESRGRPGRRGRVRARALHVVRGVWPAVLRGRADR